LPGHCQLDRSGQLTALLEGGADCSGICLGHDEHRQEHGIRRAGLSKRYIAGWDRSAEITVPLFPSGRKQIMAYETVATIVIGCLFSLVVIGFVCMYT